MLNRIRKFFSKSMALGRARTVDAISAFSENINSITPGVAGNLKQLVNAVLRESTAAALTARAGGGQQVNTPVTALNNEYTVVATIGDSATLPSSAPCVGITFFFLNATANSMNIFPDSGGKINGLGANAAYALPGGKNALITCMKTGQWYAVSGN